MMNFGEWQAKIYENPGMISVDLWMFRTSAAGKQVLTHDGTIKTIKEGEALDPQTDYFARFQDHQHLHDLAEALAKFGVKTSNDARNEGLLEATKYHLEDIRKIAKLSEGKAK